MVHHLELPAGRLARIREVLSLLGRLRKLGAPLGSPEGLRRLLELALKVAQFAGADDAVLDAIRKVLDDEELLEFLASIVGRLFGRPANGAGDRGAETQSHGAETQSPSAEALAAESLAAMDWLPLILQLLKLLASLRGGK